MIVRCREVIFGMGQRVGGGFWFVRSQVSNRDLGHPFILGNQTWATRQLQLLGIAVSLYKVGSFRRIGAFSTILTRFCRVFSGLMHDSPCIPNSWKIQGVIA